MGEVAGLVELVQEAEVFRRNALIIITLGFSLVDGLQRLTAYESDII